MLSCDFLLFCSLWSHEMVDKKAKKWDTSNPSSRQALIDGRPAAPAPTTHTRIGYGSKSTVTGGKFENQ